MNHLEQELDYPFKNTLPEVGKTIEVAPGVLWIRMGLPFALDHINLWLIEDHFPSDQGNIHGWTVIDCGIHNDITQDAWEVLFGGQLRGLPVVRVIATHCHPDHVGLADWLCSRWKVPLYMTTGEYAFARMMSAGLAGLDGSALMTHFKKHGMLAENLQEKIQERKTYYSRLVPTVPTAYHRIQDGQFIPIGPNEWQIITGFGHSPEHAALYCKELNCLISGDMILPRISTNVSVFAVEPEANPVQLYLDSIDKFRSLPDDVLVLPSHGKPFTGLHTRIAQLHRHHHDRLAEVLASCASPQSASDIVPMMFKRPLDAHQLSFALGEALAHCHKLWIDGKLHRELGEDGVYRFVKTASN